MGCVMSSIDEDEKFGNCKERKKVIKQLVGIRKEFSDSLLAYLKALRNTGATLRQFTESDTLELEMASNGLADPPSPSPNLPASPLRPPPPPHFLPDKAIMQADREEILENDDNDVSSLQEIVESVEEEIWEEAKTDIEDEGTEAEAAVSVEKSRSGKQQAMESVEDNSSAMNLCRKESTAMSMVVRSGRTLEGVVKELDDYFLKASSCIKEIAVLIDVNGGDSLLRQNSGQHDSNRGNSARVFSVLSWSWYSKSPQFSKDAAAFSGPSEPCKPGAHCATLKKFYAAEKKLFKAVKEERITKLEFERKSLSLQRQEDENQDLVKIEKTRLSVAKLDSELKNLQDCISETTSLILELIDEELLPQLVALTAGLAQMWRIMHECHHAQALISQHLRNLSDNQSTILNSEYHHQATIQFETEVSYWYNSFCKLVKSQREYVGTLRKWIRLTNCLRDSQESSDHSIYTICEKWEHGLDELPYQETSEAIKSLLSSIRSIIAQQTEEDNILRKLEKLERRLQKCSNSLAEMKKKIEWNGEDDEETAEMGPKHPLYPLYLKKIKTEALKKQVESVKENYLNSVQCSKATTLLNLQTKLPLLFQSLMEFSSASAQAIEVIHTQPSE